jgi:adenylate kinase family enzyme
MGTDGEALLLTGTRGSGKSTVCGAIGDALEPLGLPYAAIDLDWLHWSNVADEHQLLVTNLASVAASYRARGVRYFVLAQSVSSRSEAEDIRAAVGVPLKVVRLTVPSEEVLRRLRSNGRPQVDIDVALEQLDADDSGLADVDIPNAGPVDETVSAVLQWVGWHVREERARR